MPDINKITFILGSMAGGGAERVISNLAEYYYEKNKKVQIITLLNDRVDYKLPEGIELKYINTDNVKSIYKPFMMLWNLRKYIKSERPSVMISFFAKINIIVLLASIGLKIPVFISERNDPKEDNRGTIVKCLTFLLYPLSKGVIFQTNHAKNCFPKYIRRKSTIIPNPVNIKIDFPYGKQRNKIIIAVGKLMEQKNHKLLINSFSKFVKSFPEYQLHIYGDGELKGKLQKMINEKKLNDKVFLKGRTFGIFEAIYNADLFVLSSNYEGLSNALLEAMMLGTPVISTDCAGSNEIITDGINGKLVKVGDTSGLSNAIIYMIDNYDNALLMANNAKEKIEKNFSQDVVLKKWNEFINQD